MKESTAERILNDAEAVIRAARPLFTKSKGRRVVRVKINNTPHYIGVAQTDAEEEKLLQGAQEQYEGERKRLWPGQVAALTDLAKTLYPDLTRRYLKASDTVINRSRMKDLRIEELESIEAWAKKRLNRMTDAEREDARNIRKRISARLSGIK